MTENAFSIIDQIEINPDKTTIYAEGWQSWSAAETLEVNSTPYLVSNPNSKIIDCQNSILADKGVFQGSGLLAVQTEESGPVHVYHLDSVFGDIPVIRAKKRGGRLAISANAKVTHTYSDQEDSLYDALRVFANRIAVNTFTDRRSALKKTTSIPPVWCTWYGYYDNITPQGIYENLNFIESNDLPINIIQIDDGYQKHAGDWLDPSENFSGGFSVLKTMARNIMKSGKIPGIWLAPTVVAKESTLSAKHNDWLVKNAITGDPISAGNVLRSDAAVLDMTNPLAQNYIKDVFLELTEFGFRYFKIDFLYAGALRGKRYVEMSDTAAYRLGLESIRSSVADDAVLLACGAPLFPSAGLVEAMRIGPDIDYRFLPAEDHPSLPSQRNALRNINSRRYLHKALFINDPDCLIASPNMEQRENWAAAVGSFDGLRALSGNLADLDAWGIEAVKDLMRPAALDIRQYSLEQEEH